MGIVVLEGIDGCGKSTQLDLVAASLRNRVKSDFTLTTLKFPVYTNSPTGEILEAMLAKGLRSKEANTLFQSLMAVNRSEILTSIPLHSRNHVILLDRYILSGLVYGLAQGLEESWLRGINAFLPEPETTIFIDIPPALSFERRPIRRDHMESSREFVESTYRLYKEHLPVGAFIIDGTKTRERVAEEIVSKILLVNESLTYSF